MNKERIAIIGQRTAGVIGGLFLINATIVVIRHLTGTLERDTNEVQITLFGFMLLSSLAGSLCLTVAVDKRPVWIMCGVLSLFLCTVGWIDTSKRIAEQDEIRELIRLARTAKPG